MHKRFLGSGFAAAVLCLLVDSISAQAADEYAVDGMHASVYFKISHLGLSYVYGRFNTFSGNFALEGDAAKCSFAMNIKTESVDTGNSKRDEHLRSPDFFNVKQFPAITFKSTSVKAAKGGYEVTGDLTLHGTTKPLTFTLQGGKKVEFPKGVQRTGFSTEFTIKRSEFGMDKFVAEGVGDDVLIAVSFEGTKK
jgi:polyisoprenoid-binding protein YceI